MLVLQLQSSLGRTVKKNAMVARLEMETWTGVHEEQSLWRWRMKEWGIGHMEVRAWSS